MPDLTDDPKVAKAAEELAASLAAATPAEIEEATKEPVAPQPQRQVQQTDTDAPSPPVVYGDPEPDNPAQVWYCVTPEGPRTGCPPFHSDTHRHGARVQCPNCHGWSVRRPVEAGHPFLPPGF